MSDQLITHRDALRLFFTDDVYLVDQPTLHNATAKIDVTDISAVPPQEAATDDIRYEKFDHLGKNQKNVLILVNDALNKVSTEKGSELLRNIVKAISLSASDFAVVNYAQYPGASYLQFKSFFSSRLTFCFGVSASDLQLSEKPFNEIHTLEDSRIIFCSNLEQLANDQQSKKLLWGSLKKLAL